MPIRRTFKSKLITSYTLVIAVSFGLVAFFLDKGLEENSVRNIKDSLVNQALLVQNQVTPDSLRREDVAYLEALARELGRRIKSRITIIDTRGKVLADSEKPPNEIPKMENHINRPEVRAALSGVIGMDTRRSPTLKIGMLYVALPLKDKNEIIGVLRLALTLESVQKTLSAIRRIIFLGFLFALVFAFILGSIVASNAIKPVNRMIQISRKFSEGDFSRRMSRMPHDEIGELADTLNSMAQDIEDKIRQIKTQAQKLAATFNSMIEGIIVVDKSGRIVSINPTVEKIFGISKENAQGLFFLEAIRNNDIFETIDSVLKRGDALYGEITLVYPVHRVFKVNATPIFEDKAVGGCIAVIHDITEIRRLETMRRDFVANVSHELKTPLTSIKGFVETLLEGAMEDKENNRNFLKIIQEHAERLNSLVDDLLSLSHLESKEIVLKKSYVSLRKNLEGVILAFRPQLNNKKIDIKNDLPAGLKILADGGRIGQVFTNLIDNAIKFNKEKGFVKIYSQESGGKITITIEDSGIGIPEKDIPRIFERFYRVDKARSRELGGTGLGLSIVKHIVELHGGSVGVESAEGFGSKFYFTLLAQA